MIFECLDVDRFIESYRTFVFPQMPLFDRLSITPQGTRTGNSERSKILRTEVGSAKRAVPIWTREVWGLSFPPIGPFDSGNLDVVAVIPFFVLCFGRGVLGVGAPGLDAFQGLEIDYADASAVRFAVGFDAEVSGVIFGHAHQVGVEGIIAIIGGISFGREYDGIVGRGRQGGHEREVCGSNLARKIGEGKRGTSEGQTVRENMFWSVRLWRRRRSSIMQMLRKKGLPLGRTVSWC